MNSLLIRLWPTSKKKTKNIWSCTCLKHSIYCTSTLEMHTSCRKDPNSTESVEEAALKASGPMPCALLIVTSAFLSSNSDWWVCQGGGVFFRGDRERMVVRNSVLKSHLSCQKADTGHLGTRGLWCSESGQWPSFTPLYYSPPFLFPPTIYHLQQHSSASPSHLFFTVILPSMNCPSPAPPFHLLPLLCPFISCFYLFSEIF